MGKKLIYLCSTNYLSSKSFFIKWIDEIKDEVIVFIDSVKLIKIFSSICPHFGGPIIYDNKKDEFICKWHGFRFCVKSGKCLSYSIKGSLKDYNHKIKNNKIYLIKDN